MKKIQVGSLLVLSALMFSLAACDTQVASSSAASSSEASSSASSSSSLSALELAAQGAAAMLSFTDQAVPGLGTRTFELPPTVDYSAEYTFKVTYTAVQTTPYVGASIVIKYDNDPDLVKPISNCTVTAPVQDLSNAATFVKFVLTAHLAYENTEVITKHFNIRCDLIKLKAIKDISSMTSGQVVSFYGYYLGASALLPSAGGVFFGDGTAAIMIYGYSGTLPTVGATCHITGKYAPYSGLSEISGASIETVAATDANWVAMAPQTPLDLTYTGAEALANRDQGRITSISGTVAAAPVVDNYSNVKFTVTLASGSLYVLADSRYTAASVITTLKTLAAGSHVSLTGWLGYSSSYQLTAPFAVAL